MIQEKVNVPTGNNDQSKKDNIAKTERRVSGRPNP